MSKKSVWSSFLCSFLLLFSCEIASYVNLQYFLLKKKENGNKTREFYYDVSHFFIFYLQPSIFGTVASELTPKDGSSRKVSYKLFFLNKNIC